MVSPYPLLATLSGPSAVPRCISPSPGPSLPPLEPEQACSRRRLLVAGLAAAPASFWLQQQQASASGAVEEPKLETYFGTAASASSYGGYGGNSSKKDAAEYIFSVPTNWKERLVSKVEKGTNGTDAEFYNPKRKSERTYLTFLSGFRKLAPRDNVLNDLSLSDISLQDAISQADGDIRATDRTDSRGQLYYEYEIAGPETHDLIFVTCARNKLYAHFVTAPSQDWKRDEPMLRKIHDSFMTVNL